MKGGFYSPKTKLSCIKIPEGFDPFKSYLCVVFI